MLVWNNVLSCEQLLLSVYQLLIYYILSTPQLLLSVHQPTTYALLSALQFLLSVHQPTIYAQLSTPQLSPTFLFLAFIRNYISSYGDGTISHLYVPSSFMIHKYPLSSTISQQISTCIHHYHSLSTNIHLN